MRKTEYIAIWSLRARQCPLLGASVVGSSQESLGNLQSTYLAALEGAPPLSRWFGWEPVGA